MSELNPPSSPLLPLKLTGQDTFHFRCHKEISCFNQCCKMIDVTLAPYDIIRLKRRLEMTSNEFLSLYTYPFEMDGHGMPGVKLKPLEETTVCPFVTEEGCGVYEDRPTACRYYALGLMAMRLQDSPTDENLYFKVKEDHCLGHQENQEQTIDEYRKEQGVEEYDQVNRGWQQIILKKRSAGPAIGRPSPRSYQLYFMACYNVDNFRDFVFSPGFLDSYDLKNENVDELKKDDVAMQLFAFRFLKQVLYAEMSIPLKPEAEAKRLKRLEELKRLNPYDNDLGSDEPSLVD